MPTLTPQFRLFAADLQVPATQPGKEPVDIEKFLPGYKKMLLKEAIGTDARSNVAVTEWGSDPVGLRWSMIPEFGFPRQAFKVYRRRQKYAFHNWLTSPQTVTGQRLFNFNALDQYVVGISATPAAGASLMFEAIAHNGKAIPELTKTVNTSGTVIMRSPFIRTLRVTGNGVVSVIASVATDTVINESDWELIQYVGLPFPAGRTSAYSNSPQGFVFAPTSPETAARQRLMIGAFLHNSPPDLSPALPSPAWLGPDPSIYLNDIVNNPDSTLGLIQECLERCDDTDWSPEKRQPAYIAERTVPGIHQQGIPPEHDALVRIPVVASGMISVATDSYYSLGIGFGTYDFIKNRGTDAGSHVTALAAVSTTLFGGYDYMVTGEFVLRPSIDLKFLDIFSNFDERHVFAALSETLPIPVPVTALKAERKATNRPVVVDGMATESLQLSWDPPVFPQSYGLSTLIQSGNPFWLNDQVNFLDKNYRPYSTREPRNTVPDENTGRLAYVEAESPLPLSGVSHNTHFVAGIDVMGRWSAFNRVNYDAVAIEPQKPALVSCKLYPVPLPGTNPGDPPDPEKPYPPTPATIPGIIDIEFAWDWTDRSVSKIEFAGGFYNPNTVTPTIPATGFSINAADSPAHAAITVSFDNTGVPSADFGLATQLNPTEIPNTNPELIKYRLVVTGIASTMPPGVPYGVGYFVHARALEKVFIPSNNFSAWVGPGKTRLDDPRKPEVVNLPATIQYTALPDATRKARGRLSWAAADGATGYHVYEASEVAVREYIKPIAATDNPVVTLLPLTATLIERATQLRDLLLINKYAMAASRSFSKYNKEILAAPWVELDIASGSEGLTLFKISSMNGANIESDKSSPVFFAVPRLTTPAPPILMLKKLETGIEVKALNGAGAEPAGFRLYRVRKNIPSTDIGIKGLPVILDNDPGWQPTMYTNLQGGSLPGKKIVDSISIRTWRPLYYQATAVGIKNDTNGILPGESTGSATQIAFFPPTTNPVLNLLGTIPDAINPVVFITTDIPFEKIDLGRATLEIYQMQDVAGKPTKVLIGTFFSDAMPAFVSERPFPSITNTDLVTGITTLVILLPGGYTGGSVKVTDPLKKQTEIAINF